jgi:hypothetical protein
VKKSASGAVGRNYDKDANYSSHRWKKHQLQVNCAAELTVAAAGDDVDDFGDDVVGDYDDFDLAVYWSL